MATETAIRFAIFVFMLVGLSSLSSWVSYTYLHDNLILEIAGIALSWGMILLVLYVGFSRAGWDWWRPK